MKSVARERPVVDRIACPWLIKRLVDKDAEVLYVPSDQVTAFAEREPGRWCVIARVNPDTGALSIYPTERGESFPQRVKT